MQCNNVTSVIYEDCFRTLLSYYGELAGCTEQLLMVDLPYCILNQCKRAPVLSSNIPVAHLSKCSNNQLEHKDDSPTDRSYHT